MKPVLFFFLLIPSLKAQVISDPKVLDHYDRGAALMGEGKLDAAEDALLAADKQASGNCVPCLKLLFSIHQRQGKHLAAYHDLNRMSAEVKDTNRLGAQYLMLGYTVAKKEPLGPEDNQLAIDILEKALVVSKKTSVAHLHLSKLYDQAGDKPTALAHLESLLAEKPEAQLTGALRQVA